MIHLEITDDQAPMVYAALNQARFYLSNVGTANTDTEAEGLAQVIEDMRKQLVSPAPNPFPIEGVPAEPDGSSEDVPDNSARLEQGEGI